MTQLSEEQLTTMDIGVFRSLSITAASAPWSEILVPSLSTRLHSREACFLHGRHYGEGLTWTLGRSSVT